MTSLLRWRFPDSSEAGQRAIVNKRIQEFWEALTEKGPAIDALFKNRERWDLPAWMSKELSLIAPDLSWEFGPGIEHEHRLVLTAEYRRWLRPLISEMLRLAPDTGFDLFPYRLGGDPDEVAWTVKGRTGLSLDGLSARARPGRWGACDITLCWQDELTEQHHREAVVVVEALLGESVLDHWVGQIEVERGEAEPIAALKPTIEAHIEARRAQFPREPWWRRLGESSWSLIELQPQTNESAEQRDLFLGKTADLEFFQNSRSGELFSSARHSGVGELFAYLKVDHSQLRPGGFEDKAAIEDAVDAALVPLGLGCHIGGGTGLRYSYVDLALTDVDAAIPVLVEVLQKGGLGTNSWIQFFDDDLKWEWVGIRPDSPPPPMPARE